MPRPSPLHPDTDRLVAHLVEYARYRLSLALFRVAMRHLANDEHLLDVRDRAVEELPEGDHKRADVLGWIDAELDRRELSRRIRKDY
jgi:hypothetical protein